jgi:hypothetical protein
MLTSRRVDLTWPLRCFFGRLLNREVSHKALVVDDGPGSRVVLFCCDEVGQDAETFIYFARELIGRMAWARVAIAALPRCGGWGREPTAAS